MIIKIIQGLDETNQHAKHSVIIFIRKRLLYSKAFFIIGLLRALTVVPEPLSLTPKKSWWDQSACQTFNYYLHPKKVIVFKSFFHHRGLRALTVVPEPLSLNPNKVLMRSISMPSYELLLSTSKCYFVHKLFLYKVYKGPYRGPSNLIIEVLHGFDETNQHSKLWNYYFQL